MRETAVGGGHAVACVHALGSCQGTQAFQRCATGGIHAVDTVKQRRLVLINRCQAIGVRRVQRGQGAASQGSRVGHKAALLASHGAACTPGGRACLAPGHGNASRDGLFLGVQRGGDLGLCAHHSAAESRGHIAAGACGQAVNPACCAAKKTVGPRSSQLACFSFSRAFTRCGHKAGASTQAGGLGRNTGKCRRCRIEIGHGSVAPGFATGHRAVQRGGGHGGSGSAGYPSGSRISRRRRTRGRWRAALGFGFCACRCTRGTHLVRGGARGCGIRRAAIGRFGFGFIACAGLGLRARGLRIGAGSVGLLRGLI